jgi:NADH dehydrogenase FAD-containing subunit
MATEMAHPRRWRVLYEVRQAGVELISNAEVLEIGASSLRFRVEEEEREMEADSVVLATGLAANPAAISELETSGVPLVPVGDGNGVGYIEGAIREAFDAALAL